MWKCVKTEPNHQGQGLTIAADPKIPVNLWICLSSHCPLASQDSFQVLNFEGRVYPPWAAIYISRSRVPCVLYKSCASGPWTVGQQFLCHLCESWIHPAHQAVCWFQPLGSVVGVIQMPWCPPKGWSSRHKWALRLQGQISPGPCFRNQPSNTVDSGFSTLSKLVTLLPLNSSSIDLFSFGLFSIWTG